MLGSCRWPECTRLLRRIVELTAQVASVVFLFRYDLSILRTDHLLVRRTLGPLS